MTVVTVAGHPSTGTRRTDCPEGQFLWLTTCRDSLYQVQCLEDSCCWEWRKPGKAWRLGDGVVWWRWHHGGMWGGPTCAALRTLKAGTCALIVSWYYTLFMIAGQLSSYGVAAICLISPRHSTLITYQSKENVILSIYLSVYLHKIQSVIS